jgi:DNA-binding transcriptional MerR regulator
MRIGELARRTGVSPRALRYYEEQNLLAPARSGSRQRNYTESAVERVHLIRQLYATRELLERLAAEREHLDQRIADLTHARDRLSSVMNGASSNLHTGTRCQ